MPINAVVKVGAARFAADLPLALIAGPCQLESRGALHVQEIQPFPASQASRAEC